MLDEKKVKKIREMREKGLTILETAKAIGICESSVKKYTSKDFEKDIELDEKTGKLLTKQFDLEGYDFQDEIAPTIYLLKAQANEIDITLYDYLRDISNTMNKFLRITCKPEWFYYVFCEIANKFSLITEHIDENKIMEAIDNFYNREVEIENAEAFINDIEAKAELSLANTKEMWNDYQKRIESAKKEAIKEVESKSETLLKNCKEEYDQYQQKIDNSKKESDSLISGTQIIEYMEMVKNENQDLKKALEKLNHDTLSLIKAFKLVKEKNSLLKKEVEQANQEITLFERAGDQVNHLYPIEMENIETKIKNES